MSVGCGTLASPSGFGTGVQACSRSNGKQHTLPVIPQHSKSKSQDILDHWSTIQPKASTRLWGSTVRTKYGGEELPDAQADFWKSGEYWNVDSNITTRGIHEIKRNAACASHDVHRHDQKRSVVLAPHPRGNAKEQRIPPRRCLSGVVTPDCCFLESWGFDLGMRDRQARPITGKVWRPAGAGEHFRSRRSYNRNVERMTDRYRSLRRNTSLPPISHKSGGLCALSTLRPEDLQQPPRPEDIGGDVGDLSVIEDKMIDSMGRSHGTRSCPGHDEHGHAIRREAAKMSHSVHSAAVRRHPDNIPYVNGQLAPAAIYRRTFILADKKAAAASGNRVDEWDL